MPEIAGIIPAAGFGTRFGAKHKLLAPVTVDLETRPLVLHVIEAMQVCRPLVVVIRPDDSELETLLADAPVRVVFNPDAKAGMSSSIVCGIRETMEADGWCILPADMPYVTAETCQKVVQALAAGQHIVVPGTLKRTGHPVGFARIFRDELLRLQGDVGARTLLQRHLNSVHVLDLRDTGIFRDVDSQSDL